MSIKRFRHATRRCHELNRTNAKNMFVRFRENQLIAARRKDATLQSSRLERMRNDDRGAVFPVQRPSVPPATARIARRFHESRR
ncbi:hypothetical protein Bcep18194_B2658 [Burkholderia lata]|uniref:Uncharacterized protein n=1 Tax=Burkholderia lata (strain ATCC 17760 / DSM 23089 / LMG 22485 / NCIMB 9086 / R18194 / 383) TaxID=482957 RepID=Q391U7_BURL3|nr:hypothetical protein Bcep18194_B2658 [Burkholderia lata]